jgi:DNA repair protein NreA
MKFFESKRDDEYIGMKEKPFHLPKSIITHFSGNSPPEIFIGKYNYPNINVGILSPNTFEDSEEYSMPELWHKNKFSISRILENRNKLIYSRFKAEIKKPASNSLSTLQEISMAYKPVSTEFFLKKPPKIRIKKTNYHPIITNQAPLERARLQENPKIKKEVDYLISDTDSKSANSIIELHKSNTSISNIIKILSAGLLGLKSQRKLVPTRWSITATDDTISKNLLKKIRYYKESTKIQLFHSEYNGNHYEILLLPGNFSFEVIEAEIKHTPYGDKKVLFWKDHENFHGRKKYANSVTGAYYSNRLALTEYLEKIKRQCTALFFREVKPSYYSPLGVGILREASRYAFQKNPETFNTIAEALNRAQQRLLLPISEFSNKSKLLSEYGKQKKLSDF